MKKGILTYEEIKEGLNTDFIGRNIKYYNSIDSTNKKAKEIAFGEKEGTVLIAEEQVAGRGRLSREWISPKGKGIWMSIILKPELEPIKVARITLLGAAAVHKALLNMNIESTIKWPNDIIIEGKKICGILTEMDCELNKVNYVVIGIGININLEENEIPEELRDKATSVKITQGMEIDRRVLLTNILNEFEELYIPFRDEDNVSKAMKMCRENSAIIGKEIKVIKGQDIRKGRVLDINEDGELVVEFEDGTQECIFSGEISIRGINGYI